MKIKKLILESEIATLNGWKISTDYNSKNLGLPPFTEEQRKDSGFRGYFRIPSYLTDIEDAYLLLTQLPQEIQTKLLSKKYQTPLLWLSIPGCYSRTKKVLKDNCKDICIEFYKWKKNILEEVEIE